MGYVREHRRNNPKLSTQLLGGYGTGLGSHALEDKEREAVLVATEYRRFCGVKRFEYKRITSEGK